MRLAPLAFAGGALGMLLVWAFGRLLLAGSFGSGGHEAWYVSRAAGLTAYLAVSLSLAIGAVTSSAIADGVVARARLLAIHQSLGLSGLALAFAHALALPFDGFTDFDFTEVFVPFLAEDERLLNGLGTATFHLLVLATFTFWVRARLGMRLWRLIHLASVPALGGAFVHGALLGSDTTSAWVRGIYVAGVAAVVGGLVIRFSYRRPRRPGILPARAS